MKKHLLHHTLLAGWLGLSLQVRLWAGSPPATETKAEPISPLAPIAFLVEGTWVGRLPAEANTVQMAIEMRFAWTANHQGIRFDSDFVQREKHAPYASGMYCWNPAKKQIVFWYSVSDGGLHQGSVMIEPGVFVQDFTITDKEGKVTNARSRLTQHGSDAFTNEILLAKDGDWQSIAKVSYERHK